MSSEKLPFAPLFATICTLILVNWPYFRIALSRKLQKSDGATGSFSTTYLRGLYNKMCDCQHYMHGGKKIWKENFFGIMSRFILSQFSTSAKEPNLVEDENWLFLLFYLTTHYGFFFFLRRVRVDLKLVKRKWKKRKMVKKESVSKI